jgi:outer membrane protein
MTKSKTSKKLFGALCISASVFTPSSWAQDAYTLQGDVGGAVYRTSAMTRTADSANALLPYAYADYGPFYARINTLGYKAMPLGVGHMEISARVTLEGYKSAQAGIRDRANPLPIGVGTFQSTEYGAFFAYDFYDPTSGGNLLDLMYAAKFSLAGVSFYPQLGLERRSAKYVQHLYGISATESTGSGLSTYSGKTSTTPNFGLTAEYPLAEDLSLMYQVRKKWFDSAITDSPLVQTKNQISSYLAITKSFH